MVMASASSHVADVSSEGSKRKKAIGAGNARLPCYGHAAHNAVSRALGMVEEQDGRHGGDHRSIQQHTTSCTLPSAQLALREERRWTTRGDDDCVQKDAGDDGWCRRTRRHRKTRSEMLKSQSAIQKPIEGKAAPAEPYPKALTKRRGQAEFGHLLLDDNLANADGCARRRCCLLYRCAGSRGAGDNDYMQGRGGGGLETEECVVWDPIEEQLKKVAVDTRKLPRAHWHLREWKAPRKRGDPPALVAVARRLAVDPRNV